MVVGDAPQHGDDPECSCKGKIHPIEKCSMRDAWIPLLNAVKALKNRVVIFAPVGGKSLLHTLKRFEEEGVDTLISDNTEQVQTQMEVFVKEASEDHEVPFPGLF